ncbi:hypothetical protein AMTRI_Chr07g80880 [Amborella trichopoda]
MSTPNISSMIKACASNVYPKKAVSLYFHLSNKFVYPSLCTIPFIFSSFSAMASLMPQGNTLHGHHKQNPRQFNLHASNTLLITHIKSKELHLAKQVFENMHEKNVFSWTAMISGYARNGRAQDALDFFNGMLYSGIRPNYITLLVIIRVVSQIFAEQKTSEIHGFVMRNGFESEAPVITSLIGLYSSHNDTKSAFLLFDRAIMKDLILWTAMVSVCSQNGLSVEAIKFFREMLNSGNEPNHVSIVSVLPAFSDLASLLEGREIHGYSIKHDFYADTNLQNSLMNLYSKCRKPSISARIFTKMDRRDLVSWNTMIGGYAENGFTNKALLLFKELRSWSTEIDLTTINNVILACTQLENSQNLKQIHGFLAKSGFLNPIFLQTILLTAYAEFGELEAVDQLFNQLAYKDLVSWSAIISVYAKAGLADHALELFKQMQLNGKDPNSITLVSVLQACSSLGAHKLGQTIHSYVLRHGYFDSNMFLASALIDLYCKCGSLHSAKALFDRTDRKDLILWSSMISGYEINGYGKEALRTFYDMLALGLKPNYVVFISVLSACSHGGLVNEGLEVFTSMESEHQIKPDLVHYACVVDMLGRNDKVKDAVNFINEMPMEPDSFVWGALLSSCKLSDSHDYIADLAAKKLFRLDPRNESHYINLSNIYASLGQWGNVARLRGVMKEKNLKKTVGCSWLS